MRALTITEREAGQRISKFLEKYMPEAPKSFFYKMFRKKNIMLNGKKPEGGEKLNPGDEIKLFLAEETIEKFSGSHKTGKESYFAKGGASGRGKSLSSADILYEDEDVLFLNKPQGVLSQKAREEDISLVEMVTAHCLETGRMTEEKLKLFHPAICNRLDRNTSGVVIAGLSIKGLQTMSELLRGRELKKYYRCVVAGEMDKAYTLTGFLEKNPETNQVTIYSEKKEGAAFIETRYEPVATNGRVTYLEVQLITGKSHQIRAHLAYAGHPVIGDWKYGDDRINRLYRDRWRVKSQLLHSYRLELPKRLPSMPKLEGMTVTAPLPEVFANVLKGEKLGEEMEWEPGIRGDFGDRPWRSL